MLCNAIYSNKRSAVCTSIVCCCIYGLRGVSSVFDGTKMDVYFLGVNGDFVLLIYVDTMASMSSTKKKAYENDRRLYHYLY